MPDSSHRAFSVVLLTWWKTPGVARQFPWRLPENRTPYPTFIAELMLRRTRADQVARVYTRFLERFPTLADALSASDDELRTILHPLGLAWRIENIVTVLHVLRDEKQGRIPESRDDLMALPGIGDYVASAVRCFAFQDPWATLIDVNVARVVGRVFGLPVHAEARRRKPVRQQAEALVDREATADYHYALLDFAAQVCTAQRPRCDSCPIAGLCRYAIDKEVARAG